MTQSGKYPRKSSIYMPEDTYASIRNIANYKRISMQDVMRAALYAYIRRHNDALPQVPERD